MPRSARFSRAKPTGSYRVVQPSTRRVASHADSLRAARTDAEYWIKAGARSMEIQERFPSGKWVTVEVVDPKRAHATKIAADANDVASRTRGPSKEKLQQAAKWVRRELTKRADSSHPSHLAAKVLEEADEKFQLGSFGVEGWAKSPSRGYQYLNYGDPYDATIVVRSNPTQSTVHVALGGWAPYAD